MANEEQVKILKQGVDVWNQWRKDHPEVRIDLDGADLGGIDLGGANLRAAHLSGAILNAADLTEADLLGAKLIGANLSGANLLRTQLGGANLSRADCRRADLAGADLREAILQGVNFMRTDLRKADFTNSLVGHALFADCELDSSQGLEKIKHWTASTIGTDTINKSKGKIPIEFLRGCGLSDLEIESAKLAAPGLDPDQVTQIVYEIHRLYCRQPIQFYSCFISYSSQDQAFARRLHDDLQNNGVRCWFAPEDMKIGDEFRKAIGKEIRVRDKLLIILSGNSIHSEWVGDEVEKALAEERQQGAPKLFPIRLDNAVFETKDDWAEKIRLRRHIGDFSSDYDQAFQRLLRDLKPQ